MQEGRYGNQLILTAGLVASGRALGSTAIYADGDQPWHLSTQVGGVDLDRDRETRNNDTWFSVGFGRFFGNNLSRDIEYDEFEGTFRNYNDRCPGREL